jgi:hypothetical protein
MEELAEVEPRDACSDWGTSCLLSSCADIFGLKSLAFRYGDTEGLKLFFLQERQLYLEHYTETELSYTVRTALQYDWGLMLLGEVTLGCCRGWTRGMQKVNHV